MITALASISFGVWLVVAFLLAPSAWRVVKGSTHANDEWRTVCMFASWVFMAFNTRRILNIDDQVLPALYSTSIALALWVLWLLWRKRVG